MARRVYLLTRTSTDFGEHLLDVLAETASFEEGDCVEVEHDPVAHRLKVLGRSSFDDARRREDDAHFELLLRSKRRRGPR